MRKPIILGLAVVFFAVLFFSVRIFYQKKDDRVVEPVGTENFNGSPGDAAAARLKIYGRENEELKERSLLFSPDGKKSAYFQHKFITEISEIGDNDYVSLAVEEKEKRQVVFTGNFRLSYFEWLNDGEIAVYQGCGTECMVAYHIDLIKKQTRRLSLGVGYTWSPDLKYVLAYHLALQQGISVGDKFGKHLFTIRRDSPNSREFLPAKASWSPDSSKLALIIHKERSSGLELIVFDVANKFRTTFRSDLAEREFSKLSWRGLRDLTYDSGGERHLITL